MEAQEIQTGDEVEITYRCAHFEDENAESFEVVEASPDGKEISVYMNGQTYKLPYNLESGEEITARNADGNQYSLGTFKSISAAE